MKLSRRSLFAATTTALVVPHAAWAQEKVVRYGIPMTDIPLTTGQPDRGANAYQYTGHTIYDPLIAWELDVVRPAGKDDPRPRDRVEGRATPTRPCGRSSCAPA